MRALGLAAVLLCTSLSYAGEPPDVVVSHFESLQRLGIDGVPADQQHKFRSRTPVNVTFDALGRTFDLELEPNERILAPSARQALPENTALYRGRLAGRPGSWARIVMVNGMPQGLISDGGEMYAVEAPGDSAVAASAAVVFRLADSYVMPGTMSCGAQMSGGSSAAEMYEDLVGELGSAMAAAGATRQIDFSAIGDTAFADHHGANVENALLVRLNNVDGIYSEQLGVQINIPVVEIHTDADNPFTDTLESGDLLNELGRYRQATPVHRQQGLTHLYTGRNLDSTTVGIAYLNSLCHSRFGAGLSEGRRSAAFDSLIAAHEIGHNFGAPHDAEEDSACEAEPDTFLMAATLNGSNQFSQCSMDIMQPRIANAACIVQLQTVDVAISQIGSLGVVLLGGEANLSLDIANLGTQQAGDVTVAIQLSDRVSLQSVDASAGSCSSGAGSIDCQLDGIPGGSNRTIEVQTIATDTGSASFSASVSAAGDVDPNNDDLTISFTIEKGVDLAVNTLPATQVNLDQSTTLRIGTENRSAITATGVALSVAFNSGLRADSASWSLGTCTVTAQQIDCEGDSFPAETSAALDIGLTGTTAGSRTYTVTLSSMEGDTDSSNNSVDGAVTVNAVSSGASNGGGGAAGVLFLCFLATGALLRRQRSIGNGRRLHHRY